MADPKQPSQEQMLAELQKAAFGFNPNERRQGIKTRELAAQRGVNTLPDPKTYAAVSSFLGESPDELGFSVMHPQYDAIRRVADPAFAAGTALQVAPVVGALAKAGSTAGKAGARMVGSELNRAMLDNSGALARFVPEAVKPMNVIKPKGGNWLTGTAEEALQPLKRKTLSPEDMAEAREIIKLSPNPVYTAGAARRLDEYEANRSLNKWVDSNLTNYVKKEMGTPEDPVRLLHEKGISHLPEDTRAQSLWIADALGRKRVQAGYPEEGLSKTETPASAWEALADEAIDPVKAGSMHPFYVKENPWIGKLPEDTTLYSSDSFSPRNLGFDHIIDVLKEDLATGRVRPEQLNKVSMEQAVRRTYEYDQDLAAKQNAARAAQREGLPVHKEYPEGYKWLELNKPGSFAAESEAMGHSVRGYEPPKGHPDWIEGSGEQGSSGYGHGGWEGIKSGTAKVYSLVNAKGEPHVTIETNKPQNYVFSDIQNAVGEAKANEMLERGLNLKAMAQEIGYVPDKQSITQIKGKGNAAPNAEYLPYVQDFVKSGKWSDVGDIQNTGMRATKSIFNDAELQKLQAAGQTDIPHILGGEDIQRLHNLIVPEGQRLKYDPAGNIIGQEGMKRGGVVHMAKGGDVTALDEMKLALTRHGMYSPLEKAANAVPRTKGTGAEFMAEASKQAGFRPEEVADRNLKLPEGKMNKQEFLNHIQGTNMPWVTEHKLSDMGDEGEQPQYSEYQLPGGRNYREVLLQTPSSKEDPYHSSHWEGVPNVLAHMRMSDRKTDDNKKLLHLEELQSDWHQQGRKMGYAPKGGGLHDAAEQAARKHRSLQNKLHEARLNSDSVELRMKSAPTPEQREMHKKLMDKYNRDVMDLMPQTMKAEDEALKAKMLASSSVPDAPFKKNWHELGMKHVLHHAAKHGYHGVVITPGEEQAKRWQDEGLKVHYDQKIPEYLNKFGKQFGVQVGSTALPDMPKLPAGHDPEDQESSDLMAQTKLHHFPITEPMRQHILTQGLPMYRSGGIIHKA